MLLQTNQPVSPLSTPELRGTCEALESLRVILSDCLELAPQERAVDMAKYLGVDGKLAGQVLRAMGAPSIEGFAASLPPYRGLKRIAGNLPQGGDRLSAACETLEEAVNREVGERWALDGVLKRYSSGADGEEQASDIEVRKAAYRSYASAFGFRTEHFQRVQIIRPSETTSDRLDTIDITMKDGLVRMQPGLVIPVYGFRMVTGNAVDRDPVSVPLPEPIFEVPDGVHPGCVLDWCEPSPLPVRTRLSKAGLTLLELHGGTVGSLSRASVAVAYRSANSLSAYRGTTQQGEPVNYSLRFHVSEPIGLMDTWMVLEHSIARSTTVEFVPTQRFPEAYGIHDPFNYPLSIPLVHRQQHIRAGGGTPTSRLERLIKECLVKAGWDSSNYVVHRVRCQYPPLQSIIWCCVDLPVKE